MLRLKLAKAQVSEDAWVRFGSGRVWSRAFMVDI